jgi:hypothetical protein
MVAALAIGAVAQPFLPGVPVATLLLAVAIVCWAPSSGAATQRCKLTSSPCSRASGSQPP